MKSFLLLMTMAFVSMQVFAATKPVPSACTPAVNAALLAFVPSKGGNSSAELDNVMVRGNAISASFEQPASSTGTGPHEVTLLAVLASNGSSITVELLTNDDLDGIVRAASGDSVFAYGQTYITSAKDIRQGKIHPVAGVHDTHCATNSHMDDGWVVVNNTHYPAKPCSRSSTR